MSKHNYHIARAAVVGSGTMGGAIAALLAGVGISVNLLDIAPSVLTKEEASKGLALGSPKVRNRIVQSGLDRISTSRPQAFYSKSDMNLIRIGNLVDDFAELSEVDWVIEVIVEDMATKRDFFKRLDTIRPYGQIVSSNTSGIPICNLATGLSEDFRRHFLGTHFFNPPRYLRLLEVIPTRDTDSDLVDFFIQFASHRLGKGVVVCKDTPNFIANRVGWANNGFRMRFGIDNGYTVEEVDEIAGPLMGYPKTAVFRLLDLVGLDVAIMVAMNIANTFPGDSTGQRAESGAGEVMNTLVERSWLGNKTGIGFYKQIMKPDGTKEFWVLDRETMKHVPPSNVSFESIGKVRKIDDLGERLRVWVHQNDRAARYVWHTLAFLFSYASDCVPEISDDILSIDRAMRWGYMMEAGPFECWDMLGVPDVVDRMESDGYIVAPWVRDMLRAGHTSFYRLSPDGRQKYDPLTCEYVPIDELLN